MKLSVEDLRNDLELVLGFKERFVGNQLFVLKRSWTTPEFIDSDLNKNGLLVDYFTRLSKGISKILAQEGYLTDCDVEFLKVNNAPYV